MLVWPPCFLDFNLIEHLWDVLDKHHNLENIKDLCQIPQHIIRGFVESMPGRIKAVLAVGGLHDIKQVVLLLWLIMYSKNPSKNSSAYDNSEREINLE